MKKIILAFFAVGALFSSCSSDGDKNENLITYSSNIDNVIYWSRKDECKNIKGHTGLYSGYVDSTKIYSYGFKMPISEISNKPLKKVIFKSWILSDNPASKVTFLISIEKDGKSLLWKGVQVTDFMKNKNEWFQVVGEAEIPKNLPKDASILMYLWSPDNTSALIDDFEISFE